MSSWKDIKAKILAQAMIKEKERNAQADAMKATRQDYPAIPGKSQSDPWWVGLEEDDMKTISCQLGVPMPTQDDLNEYLTKDN